MAPELSKWKINENLTFENFIIFEPASLRVESTDILLRGSEIVPLFQQVLASYSQTSDIKDLILMNRLRRIGTMLDLITDFNQVIMTRFFSKIWRRYTYFSHLGENFLTVSAFNDIFPDFTENKDNLLAKRLDLGDEPLEVTEEKTLASQTKSAQE
ncbi:MAG: hypothetical protein HRT90_11370 [Candidatus Margulisbacteria bacterium]|nr:hypothetical protein [Candidatus Margulisiibacteriota bacterium]